MCGARCLAHKNKQDTVPVLKKLRVKRFSNTRNTFKIK